tara:strand:+ start:4433 stop:4639 length:207 start_codon:yes stop_codon:yes gene_type:complete
MRTDLQEFIVKLENAVRRLPYANRDGFIDTMHLVEVYCEISDLLIEFDIEQYQESSSSEEETSEEEQK